MPSERRSAGNGACSNMHCSAWCRPRAWSPSAPTASPLSRPLEEATLEAIRLLPLGDALVAVIRELETCSISSEADARDRLAAADDLALRLRTLGGDPRFPASFDTAAGWRGTILASYDWVNLGAHLGARFPQTAHGGRGSAEEARDLLASTSA